MPIRISLYRRNLRVEEIVRLSSVWKEFQSGFQEERTTEEIVCLRNGQPFRLIVVWTQTFFPNASITPRIDRELPISQEEYEKIREEQGGILDTPELIEALDRQIELEKALRDLVPVCPKCGVPMAEREGKRGKFWGCSRFPKCDGTRKWEIDLANRKRALYQELEKYQGI